LEAFVSTETTGQLQQILDEHKNDASPAQAATVPHQRWISVLVCIGLAALVLACFFRTLKDGYFLADDFGEFGYIEKVVHGRWDLFVANWTGNYMQIPSMAVYRPWQLMSLLTCYLIGKANPFPWYAANILFYVGDAVMLFLLCRELTRSWSYTRSMVTSAIAGALFVVNPLHCESVSWVVGRVDIECCFYCLVATWSFLRYLREKKRTQIAVSILFFWMGILVKEMAIGFPLIATALSFLNLQRPVDHTPLKQRILNTARECWPIWLSTVIYFTVRYLALGTFVGGYIGTIGNGQSISAIKRWLDFDSLHRVFYPFAVSIFPKDNIWVSLLTGCYSILLSIFAIKIFRREFPWRLSLFCLVWIISTALPIYKLWGFGMDLEGARFSYFLTVAFGTSAVLLAMAPGATSEPTNDRRPDSSLGIIAAIALLLWTFAFYKTCLRTNAVWVHASKEVKAVMAQGLKLATSGSADEQYIVLGIPKKHAGAHMIYNGITLRLGLMPPISPINVATRVINFDPLFYGYDEYINSARFKQCLNTPGVKGPFIWNSDKLAFLDNRFTTAVSSGKPLQLIPSEQTASVQAYADGHATMTVDNGICTFKNDQIGDGVQFNKLDFDPRQYDFLQFEYRLPPDAVTAFPMVFQCKWQGSKTGAADDATAAARLPVEHPIADNQFHSLRIPVSHYWHWYACGDIHSLALIVPPMPGISVRAPQLLADNTLRPKMSVLDLKSDVSGVYVTAFKTKFSLDASSIPGAAKLLVECSKPDYFFDQIEGDLAQGIFAQKIFDGNKLTTTLPHDLTPFCRYCEVRVKALDANGKPLGEYSEPVTVFTANQATIPSRW
jgi:hypothetical protein